MRRNARGGYSLIEMIVVIGLIGVVTSLGTALFNRMSDGWRGVRIRSELDARAQNVFNQMRQDLGRTIAPSLVDTALKGTDRTFQTDDRFFQIPLEDDLVKFPALESNADGAMVGGLTTYYVDRVKGGDELRRMRTDYADAAATGITLAEGVVRFDVEYDDGRGWTGAWDRPEPPRAVRVGLTLLDADSGEQVTRKAVLPIRVN